MTTACRPGAVIAGTGAPPRDGCAVVIDLARAIRSGPRAGTDDPCLRHPPVGDRRAHGSAGWADHVRLEGVTSACGGPLELRRGVRRQGKRSADLIKINACVSPLLHLEAPYREEMTDEGLEAASSCAATRRS